MSRAQEEKARRRQNENKGQVPASSAPLQVGGASVRKLTLEYREHFLSNVLIAFSRAL